MGSASSAAAGLLAAVGGAAAWHARLHSPYSPILERVDIPVPESLAELRGLRIGFVTDTHVGPLIHPSDVARAIAPLISASPDVLLLGGDFICESPRHAEAAADILGDAARQAPLGAIAVLGNHDYSNDAERITNRLRDRSIHVLRNEAVSVGCGKGGLWIVGIDDAILGSPDIDLAFSAVPPGAPAIALWHEPDWAELAAQRGAFLQLSGHSHGGQVRLPFAPTVAAPSGGRRYVKGLNLAGEMPVYTSRGVGMYRPPVRFRCPPEVTLLTLR